MANFGPNGDTPSKLTHASGWTEKGAGLSGSGLSTGDLRRKYNFGSRLSELSIAQDPFFRFVSKVGKSATDDPEFKFTEKRSFWEKRHGYVVGFSSDGAATKVVNDATLKDTGNAAIVDPGGAGGQIIKVYMASDFYTAGNIANVIGKSSQIGVGAVGTRPTHFLPNQVVRIPTTDASNPLIAKDYILAQVLDINNNAADTTVNLSGGSGDTLGIAAAEITALTCQIVRYPDDATCVELANFSSDHAVVNMSSVGESAADKNDGGMDRIDAMRTHVSGTSYVEGSSLLGKTWSDQPYSTGSGLVQTFRDEWGMTNKARATVLKYDKDEFARVWREHLIAHKWDLEQAGLFSSQGKKTMLATNLPNSTVDEEHWYTQGAVDFIANYGNVFSLDTATKTSDDFLDDMSKYMDPRYSGSKATVFFCDTATYNWLHKLGGYFKNNIEISTNFRADMAITGKKKVFGVDITTISTPYGDMNVARNIHLDGTNVKILGINMKHVKYRPLVGNGLNRDTSIYVGVQTLENSGVDKRVDMLLTEAGYEWSMPETHVMWK
jgi:hypothetical protein